MVFVAAKPKVYFYIFVALTRGCSNAWAIEIQSHVLMTFPSATFCIPFYSNIIAKPWENWIPAFNQAYVCLFLFVEILYL